MRYFTAPLISATEAVYDEDGNLLSEATPNTVGVGNPAVPFDALPPGTRVYYNYGEDKVTPVGGEQAVLIVANHLLPQCGWVERSHLMAHQLFPHEDF